MKGLSRGKEEIDRFLGSRSRSYRGGFQILSPGNPDKTCLAHRKLQYLVNRYDSSPK